MTSCAAPSRRVCDHRVTTGQTGVAVCRPVRLAVRRTGRPPRRTGEHLVDPTAAATWPVAGYGHRKVAVASELRFCRYVLAVDPEADCADGSKEAIRHRLRACLADLGSTSEIEAISLARRSSRFSRSRSFSRARSSIVSPGRRPASTSAPAGPTPAVSRGWYRAFSAIDSIAFHCDGYSCACSKTIRTACSRSSAGCLCPSEVTASLHPLKRRGTASRCWPQVSGPERSRSRRRSAWPWWANRRNGSGMARRREVGHRTTSGQVRG